MTVPESDPTTLHVQRATAGHEDSLGWLVERFTPLLVAQARYRLGPVLGARMDPEDLVAEAWLVALPKLDRIVPREGRYTPVFLRFLASIVQNVANNRMRGFFREARHLEAKDEDGRSPEEDLSASITGAISRLGERELARNIAAALAGLDEAGRTVIILRGIEGRSNDEVAEILDEVPNTVSRRYRRALDKLRAALPKSIFDEFVE